MKSLIVFFAFLLNFTDASASLLKTFGPADFCTVNADSPLPRALIAGGSRGIGYSIAEALAKRNYNLILIARNEDSLVLQPFYKIKLTQYFIQ